MLMQATEVLQLLRDHASELAEYQVERTALFGSVARNEAKPQSDIDILVEFRKPIGLFEFVRLKRLLESILGRPVDLVTFDALRDTMRGQILAEALYA
jgi:predicted nucleotidyltransferase